MGERTFRLEFSTGEVEFLEPESWHPIHKSPFVQNLIEMSDEDASQVNIPLPAFIEREPMIGFYNLLFYLGAGENMVMGFGMHRNETYKTVFEVHHGYYLWAASLSDPSAGMQEFLDWAKFARTGSKPNREDVPEILRIAKFFQVDMCARCGCLEGSDLNPCRRTAWPKVPKVVPNWDEVTKNSTNKLKDWRKAWEKADNEREQETCASDDVLCIDCILREGCQVCREYECETCQADTETPKTFQEWHEKTPNPEYEDDYGRRGHCAFQSLNLTRCLHCGRRICRGQECGTECQDCNRRACGHCKEDLDTNCSRCKFIIENNGDFEIGPIDREEYVCRSCFDARPHYCGCGEPSYDPYAESENEAEAEEEDDEYAEYDEEEEEDEEDNSERSN